MKANEWFKRIGQSCASRNDKDGLALAMAKTPSARERCWIADAYHNQKHNQKYKKWVHAYT